MFLPEFFASYIAASAFLTSSVASFPCDGKMLMPILPPENICWFSIRKGLLSSCKIFLATNSVSLLDLWGFNMIANSSPPSLATKSDCLTVFESLDETSLISLSPAGWPKLSLVSLNWSKSIYMTAMDCLLRKQLFINIPRCSSNCLRLGSCVRVSLWANDCSS